MAEIYKTTNEAYVSLKNKFETRINEETKIGSVIDIFNKVIADECGDMYNYIEANKNPYLFTNTNGEDLDKLGYWVSLPREEYEEDDHYRYRLKDWMLTSEASNTRAIENALLNPKYSSNIQYVPYTHGSGTGTCYVIPLQYEEDVIINALGEAQQLIKNIVSPSLYVEYLVPAVLGVRLQCYISTTGDEDTIKANITTKTKDYINNIAPDELLKIGEIIKIGVNEPGVQYFNIVSYFIDDEQQTELTKTQGLETKFLFDSIIWTDNTNTGI